MLRIGVNNNTKLNSLIVFLMYWRDLSFLHLYFDTKETINK